MIKILFVILMVVHGLTHLVGPVKAFRLIKRELSADSFQPECAASMLLDLVVGEGEDHLFRNSMDQMIFACVY